jgi:hypothetical protein
MLKFFMKEVFIAVKLNMVVTYFVVQVILTITLRILLLMLTMI